MAVAAAVAFVAVAAAAASVDGAVAEALAAAVAAALAVAAGGVAAADTRPAPFPSRACLCCLDFCYATDVKRRKRVSTEEEEMVPATTPFPLLSERYDFSSPPPHKAACHHTRGTTLVSQTRRFRRRALRSRREERKERKEPAGEAHDE